jgi:hypothetical protein
MPKAKGARGNGRPSLGGSKTAPPKKDDHATLAELGVSMRDKGQGFAGADIRSIGSLQRQGHPVGTVDSGNGLLRYAVFACLRKVSLFQMQTQ